MIVTGVTDCAILAILRHRLHCNCTAIASQLRRLGFRALPLLRRSLAAAPVSVPVSVPWASCTLGGVGTVFSRLFGRSSRGTASEICRLWVPAAGVAVGTGFGLANSSLTDTRSSSSSLEMMSGEVGRCRLEGVIFWPRHTRRSSWPVFSHSG